MDYHDLIKNHRKIHSYIYKHGTTKAAKHFNISYSTLNIWKRITLPLLQYDLVPISDTNEIVLNDTKSCKQVKTNDDDIEYYKKNIIKGVSDDI